MAHSDVDDSSYCDEDGNDEVDGESGNEDSSPTETVSKPAGTLGSNAISQNEMPIHGEPQSKAAQSNLRSGNTKHATRKRKLKPDELYVEWDRLAASRWGQDRLDRYISIPELDDLIGWNCHLVAPTSSPIDRNSDNCPTTNATGLPLIAPNRLLGLATSNVPLRPSLLKHLIQDPATNILKAIDEATIAASLSDQERQPRKRTSNGPLWEAMNHSTAVALGILAEEMITATLLPLAEKHVKRCRWLQERQEESARSNRNSNEIKALGSEAAFHHWTLPPEEAILQIFHTEITDSASTSGKPSQSTPDSFAEWTNGHGLLPTTRPPTHTTVTGAIGTSLLNQPAFGVRDRHAVAIWCNRHQIDPSWVRSNHGIFRLLLPLLPPLPPQSNTASVPQPAGDA